MWQRYFLENTPKLGRWCHPSSQKYENKCDQMLKMSLANMDSCMGFTKVSVKSDKKTKEYEKDPISILLIDGYGF